MSDSKKSIRWGYLPDEILTHIFTFLPIKSIIICTTVSKTWKSLIKNPTFISTHLHHSRNQNQNLFLLLSLSRNDKQVYTLHKEDDDPDFTEYTSFDSPAPALHLHNVVGTFNGLICLSYGLPNRAEEIFLWNPCVRKFLQLPYPDATVDTHGTSYTSFGFGFDPKTNDYKVVRIISSRDDFVKSRPVVEVYSLFASEWRMLSLPPICAKIRIGRATFANGALHWIAFTNDDKQFVLVFDLGDEVFREILLPEFPGQVIWTRLSVYGNSIAGFRITVGIDEKVQINICVMKEYGVASSWTPFFTADFEFVGPTLRPIGFRRNGDAVFVLGEEKLVCWNPERKEFKDLRMIGDHDPFIDSYIESLVLLDKNRILSTLHSRCDGFGKSQPVVVEVYSLSTSEWRMLSASASLPPMCGILIRGPQAFANGALHLIAITNDKKPFVLVFDLGDKVFYQILLPELPWKMKWIHVFVYGNSITGFQKRVGGGKLNIWVMKEYGVASSWTQFSHQYLKLGLAKQCPVGFWRNGEVVL